jgi:hypothetical protein
MKASIGHIGDRVRISDYCLRTDIKVQALHTGSCRFTDTLVIPYAVYYDVADNIPVKSRFGFAGSSQE